MKSVATFYFALFTCNFPFYLTIPQNARPPKTRITIAATTPAQEKKIVFTKEKAFGVYHSHSGSITGPYTEAEATEKAEEYAGADKGTAFIVKVLGTVKPERKTVKVTW